MATREHTGRLLVAGEWIETGEWIEVRSPYSGEVVGRVARASREHMQRAIDAAADAMREPLPTWRRAEVLEGTARLVAEHAERLAQTICAEAGKPLQAARVEAARAVDTLTAAAVVARSLAGQGVPVDSAPSGEGKLAYTLRTPIGVVGAISPFNFPLNLVAHKLAPAIAAGCAVVLKPATATPLTALLLAELFERAGLPAGWMSVLVGDAQAFSEVLIADDRVRLLTFTGSAQVGWQLRSRARHQKVLLELGNSTPVIVAPDADLDLAAAKTAAGGYGFAGQSCISAQRVYVHASVHDAFVERLLRQVDALRVGDPADEQTDVGPLIDTGARDRVRAWVAEARAQGATVLRDGGDGEVMGPVVIDDARDDMKVVCLEVFGPVVSVLRYDTLDEAVARANGTDYGLQAAVFTRDLDTAMLAAHGLEFGGVVVNETPSFRSDPMPYGGTKQSGNTKEGPAWSVREMTEERLVVIQRPVRDAP